MGADIQTAGAFQGVSDMKATHKEFGLNEGRFDFGLAAAGIERIEIAGEAVTASGDVIDRPKVRPPSLPGDPDKGTEHKKPKRYRVILVSGEHGFCGCAIFGTLQSIFDLNPIEAGRKTAEAQATGRSIIKVFPSKEVAETKALEAEKLRMAYECFVGDGKIFFYEPV